MSWSAVDICNHIDFDYTIPFIHIQFAVYELMCWLQLKTFLLSLAFQLGTVLCLYHRPGISDLSGGLLSWIWMLLVLLTLVNGTLDSQLGHCLGTRVLQLFLQTVIRKLAITGPVSLFFVLHKITRTLYDSDRIVQVDLHLDDLSSLSLDTQSGSYGTHSSFAVHVFSLPIAGSVASLQRTWIIALLSRHCYLSVIFIPTPGTRNWLYWVGYLRDGLVDVQMNGDQCIFKTGVDKNCAVLSTVPSATLFSV